MSGVARRVVAAVCVVGLTVTACTDDQDRPTVTASPGTTTTTTTAPPPPAPTAPQGTPNVTDARAALDRLTVAPASDPTTYDPAQFGELGRPREGECLTRAAVLMYWTRTPYNTACAPTGTVTDPYTGTVLETAEEMHLDHVVSPQVAWVSGAAVWEPQRRNEWLNDLANLVVTGRDQLQAKNGRPVNEWTPPRADYLCTYARIYVAVKVGWQLSVTEEERAALVSALEGCTTVSGTATVPPTSSSAPPTSATS